MVQLKKGEWDVPGVVKRVEPALVWPWVLGWVEALFSGGVGVHLREEGQGAVELGVPGDRADGRERRRGQCCTRVQERLAGILA